MAGGPEESDRRTLDAWAFEAIAEFRRLFLADAPPTEASEEAAQELVAAAGRIARTAASGAAAFEPLDAIEALLRAQAIPEPAAFSLVGLRQPGDPEPAARVPACASGPVLRRAPASELLSAAAEERGMSDEELVAYL